MGYHLIEITIFKQKRNLLIGITIFLLSPIIIWMVKYHPYQYVYFNFLAGKNINIKFDMDYWGVSNLNAMKIIIQDSKDATTVGKIGTTDLYISKIFLHKNYRDRITVVDKTGNADYLIYHYRNWTAATNITPDNFFDNYEKFYEIKVDGSAINTIYKKNDK